MTSCHRSRAGLFFKKRLDTTRPIALNRFSRSLSSSCCAVLLIGYWESLLLDDFDDGRDLFGRDPPPFPFRPTRYHLDFETLVQPNSPVIVAQSIGKQSAGQLSRAASTIAPAKAGRGMVEQVQPQRQWLGFLAVTDSDEGLSRDGIAVGGADVGFAGHCFAPLQKVQDRTVERRGVSQRRSALRSAIRLSAGLTAESRAVP